MFGDKPIFSFEEGIEARWASPENFKGEKGEAAKTNGGRKGSPFFPLEAGESKVLAEVTGTSGMIRRIWMTVSLGKSATTYLRGIRLDFYWDGCKKPAISAPLGDFFGLGLGKMVTFQSALFANPEGRSFNCFIPMPFRTGMKVVATNESGILLEAFFYDIDYTIGDSFDENTLYLHAHYRRENPTTMRKDYEILPRIHGRGRYLGANIGVIADKELYFKSWWGEGEVKVYLDGDREYPTLCGTGTEDYIGTAWGQGQYSHMYQGCPVADMEKLQYCFYRYHITDPIYFKEDILVAIQQIGCWELRTKSLFIYHKKNLYEAGSELIPLDLTSEKHTKPYGLYERCDDVSSCCYFYLDKPENELPEIDPAEKRFIAATSNT